MKLYSIKLTSLEAVTLLADLGIESVIYASPYVTQPVIDCVLSQGISVEITSMYDTDVAARRSEAILLRPEKVSSWKPSEELAF